MKKDEILVKLYNSNIRQAVSKKHKECLAEEGKLVKNVDELIKLLNQKKGLIYYIENMWISKLS